MKKIQLIMRYGMVLFLFGCASTEKAVLSSGDNAAAGVSEVSRLMKKAEQEQTDLLSFAEYMKGAEYFKKAERALSAHYKNEIILDNAAIAKAHFQKALELSSARSSNATRILQARKASLKAGLRKSKNLLEGLYDVDEDLRDETDNFSQVLGPKKFSKFQKKYFALEVKAVQFRELDTVKKAIQKSTSANAEDLAPNSLTAAMLDLTEAENLIAQSPRNPEVHKASVEKSAASSVLLTDVMDVILNAKGTPENIALRIVSQNRELGTLSKNVGKLEENLKSTQSNLMEKEDVLKKQKEELKKSSTQIRFQNAMEEAGKQFSDEEASVYQQGNKLIFRLKRINFASGTSTVPVASKSLLSKVNDIIKSLDAEMVAVQGHTDSVGAGALNLKLSTRRATAVANYLTSLAGGYKIRFIGYGESKPIASNETKEGRAINRRVDLVVTAKVVTAKR